MAAVDGLRMALARPRGLSVMGGRVASGMSSLRSFDELDDCRGSAGVNSNNGISLCHALRCAAERPLRVEADRGRGAHVGFLLHTYYQHNLYHHLM